MVNVNGRKKKSIISFCLILILLSCMNMSVFASSNDDALPSNGEPSVDAVSLFSCRKNIYGQTGSTLDDLFSSEIMENIQLNIFNLLYTDGKYQLEATLNYNSNSILFDSTIELYKNESTENSADPNTLILGEATDSENIHFVQLKFDKNLSEIRFILQLFENNQLIAFSIPVNYQDFDSLYKQITNPFTGAELDEKIIKLYNVSSNVIGLYSEDTSSNTPVISIDGIDRNVSPSNYSTLSGWTNLITALNKNGSITLSNYKNINASLFKTSGWHHDNSPTMKYGASVYSTQNGLDEYLAQFAFFDIVSDPGWTSGAGDIANIQQLRLEVKYVDGMVVRYNTITDKLSVLYYNFGLDLTNFELGIYNLTNDAFFISRSVNQVSVSGVDVLKAAIALYAPGDTFVSLFEHLQPYENQSTNYTQYFHSEYEQQYLSYGHKVIQGISVNSGSNKLNKKGHFINIAGEVKYIKSDGYSYTTGSQCTCNHYL